MTGANNAEAGSARAPGPDPAAPTATATATDAPTASVTVPPPQPTATARGNAVMSAAALTDAVQMTNARVESVTEVLSSIQDTTDSLNVQVEQLTNSTSDHIGELTSAVTDMKALLEKAIAQLEAKFHKMSQDWLAAQVLAPPSMPPTNNLEIKGSLAASRCVNTLKTFGPELCLDQKQHWPADMLHDTSFWEHLAYMSKRSTSAKTVAAAPAVVVDLTADTVMTQAAAPTAAAPTTVAPTVVAPTTVAPAVVAPTTVAPTVVAPQSATGHLKIEIAPPLRFNRIDLSSDIGEWLEQVQENCILGNLDKSNWVRYAVGFLEGPPKTEWLSHKQTAQLTNTVPEIMAWDNFVDWAKLNFTTQNKSAAAYEQLQKLRQTTTVAAYKARFNPLALAAKLSIETQLHMWYSGLKDDVRRSTLRDPSTQLPFANSVAAQLAAMTQDTCNYGDADAGKLNARTSDHAANSAQPTRRRNHTVATQTAASDGDVEMAEPPAKRHNKGGISRPQYKSDDFTFFPPYGTVQNDQVPIRVKDILDTFNGKGKFPPAHPLIPKGDNGLRPSGCWIKGCDQDHNYRSCPTFINYLQKHPAMDAPTTDTVRPDSHHANAARNVHRRR